MLHTVFMVPSIDSVDSLELSAYNTVEAEYGDRVIEGIGGGVTLAHHGSRANNPAPCIAGARSNDLPIIVSHIDLDTMGGIMDLSCMGSHPDDPFWQLAAFVDVHGLHRIKDAHAPDLAISMLYAWYAWAEENPAPRVTEPTDVTDYVMDAISFIQDIQFIPQGFSDEEENLSEFCQKLLVKGEEWRKSKEAATESCLISEDNNIRVFITPGTFCGASYYSPTLQCVAKATVALNTKYNSVTLAFEDGGKQFDAVKIVQSLWGPEAGGRPGIAGSPRGKAMTRNDLDEIVKVVQNKYNLA